MTLKSVFSEIDCFECGGENIRFSSDKPLKSAICVLSRLDSYFIFEMFKKKF